MLVVWTSIILILHLHLQPELYFFYLFSWNQTFVQHDTCFLKLSAEGFWINAQFISYFLSGEETLAHNNLVLVKQ